MNDEKINEAVEATEAQAEETKPQEENRTDAAAAAPDQAAEDAGDVKEDVADQPADDNAAPADTPAQASADDKTTVSSDDTAEVVNSLKARLMDTTVDSIASKLGIRPDRVAYVTKLADLSGVDISQDGAAEKVEAALRSVINTVPEFATQQDTGGTGGHRRDSAKASLEDEVAQAMGVVR